MESPTLTLEEIKGNLCYYDAENPNNNLDCYDDEEERPKPRENCHCDNCFYGRDKLARYILSNAEGGRREFMTAQKNEQPRIPWRALFVGVWQDSAPAARAYRDLTRRCRDAARPTARIRGFGWPRGRAKQRRL
jgi:hypothetical protein